MKNIDKNVLMLGWVSFFTDMASAMINPMDHCRHRHVCIVCVAPALGVSFRQVRYCQTIGGGRIRTFYLEQTPHRDDTWVSEYCPVESM